MTQILIANIGSYPRVGEDKDQQRHRRGHGYFQRKEISAHAFRDVEQSVIQEIVREQLICELDEVTDGLIRWQDPISHFCKNVSGVEATGLARYFNTNFYYRVPVIASRPRLKEPILAKEFQFAQSVSSKPVRVVVTGPLTLAMHVGSKMKSLSKLTSRMDFFTDLIKQEIKALLRAGATIIQLDEPSLAANPNAFNLVQKSLENTIPSETTCQFVLALYFSPLAPLWDLLQTLPVHGLNLDFTIDGNELFSKLLDKPGSKDIGFGWIDARSTRMESVESIAHNFLRWLDKTQAARCYLTPSSGLELLPRNVALEKLRLLANIRSALHTSAPPGATVHA